MPPAPDAESATLTRGSVWRAIVGLLWVLGALTCAVLSRDALLAVHPAYPVTLALVLLVGLALVGTGMRRVPADRPRHRVTTAFGRVFAVLATAAVLGAIGYCIPLPASPDAVAAMTGDATVMVTESPTRIVLAPAGSPRTGLVFFPGAKVDARAYVPLLRQVAAQGTLVEIVKEPFGIAFLALNDPGTVIERKPSVPRWAVGGHSLGGVAAAAYASRADARAAGLLFWASYPAGSLADRTDLTVASVSGTADGLSTPADIEASRSRLPPDTVFTAVPGGVHAYFGDYGPQAGDGTPTVDRATAQRQIVAATAAFLSRMAAR